MTNYTFESAAARKADQRGKFITETGKYVGRLIRAEEIETDKGTRGIDFSFVSRDGQQTRFALYTEKKTGERINIGHSFVIALMTCLKVREIRPTEAKVRKWDADANAEVDAVAPCYVELMNKDIGVLLEAEEYEKNNGGIGTRMVLAGVFQAHSELTASEVLDQKTKPEQLGKIVATLRDRPLKKQQQRGSGSSSSQSGGPDNFDDIPWN